MKKANIATISISLALIIFFLIIIYYLINRSKSKMLSGLPVSEFEKKFIEISQENTSIKVKVFFSKWFDPYSKYRKTNYPAIADKYGIYFIRKKTSTEIVYIGFSQSNLYKALYRHFQWYNDSGTKDGKQKRVFYENPTQYEVMIGICPKKYAAILEKHYIFEYRPKDCEIKYDYYFSNNEADSRLKNPHKVDFWEEIEGDVEVPF